MVKLNYSVSETFRERGTDHVLHEKVDENAAHIAATFNE